jgi:hypothetical protein
VETWANRLTHRIADLQSEVDLVGSAVRPSAHPERLGERLSSRGQALVPGLRGLDLEDHVADSAHNGEVGGAIEWLADTGEGLHQLAVSLVVLGGFVIFVVECLRHFVKDRRTDRPHVKAT